MTVQSPSALPCRGDALSTLGLLGLFMLWSVLLSLRTFNYPWFWDDLHLIRTYSEAELAQETGQDRPVPDGALFLPRIDFWEP